MIHMFFSDSQLTYSLQLWPFLKEVNSEGERSRDGCTHNDLKVNGIFSVLEKSKKFHESKYQVKLQCHFFLGLVIESSIKTGAREIAWR